jgi:hypothetical protein
MRAEDKEIFAEGGYRIGVATFVEARDWLVFISRELQLRRRFIAPNLGISPYRSKARAAPRHSGNLFKEN